MTGDGARVAPVFDILASPRDRARSEPDRARELAVRDQSIKGGATESRDPDDRLQAQEKDGHVAGDRGMVNVTSRKARC